MDNSEMPIPQGRFTRTGIRRSGDDYQDLCALELLIEMLEHPTRYKWVKVEADEAGVLDDVLAQLENQSYVARQVKYAGHPEEDSDVWTWDKLLLEKPAGVIGPKPSLLSRWFRSWQELRARGTIAEASLESNRKAGNGLRELINASGLISFDSIPGATKTEILRQFGDEVSVRQFFSIFRFRVDKPELEVLNESLSRRFFALGGTREGWLSLKDNLRRWVRERHLPPPEGAITVTVLREAANWRCLTSLPENFEIPDDYVLPSETFHNNFFQAVIKRLRSCQVLTAPPAFGKSTYLSFFVVQLQKANFPVVRHHYFLSVSDQTYGRFDHLRVVESLMKDISKACPEAIGTLGAKNPSPEELRYWLTTVGKYFAIRGKVLVVVIDGLDHVWRDGGNREELVRLFEYLLPAPPGVVIVVGTQPVDDNQLPPILLRECPRDQWLHLESLTKNAVAMWLKKHQEELDLPKNNNAKQDILDQLAAALYSKTDGHPLYLRFVLGYLLDRGQAVTAPAIAEVPGTPSRDIMDYYSALWRSIPEKGQDILHLLACTKFPWPPTGVIEALDPGSVDIAAVNSALRNIQHVLVPTSLGFRPFHPSLLIFVRSQESYSRYEGPMRIKARHWLANNAPDYWRWAYSWLTEAEDGQVNGLINGPNRAWLLESLSRGYPQDQMLEILGRGALAALEHENLNRFIELALLKDYLKWQEPTTLLDIQLALDQDEYLRDISLTNREFLASSDLLSLARFESRLGNMAAVNKCFDTMKQQIPRDGGEDAFIEWAKKLAEIVALTPDVEIDRLVRFIRQFEAQKRSSYVLDGLAFTLRREKNISFLRKLLCVSEFLTDEEAIVRKHSIGLAFESGIDVGITVIENWDDPFSSLYKFLRSKRVKCPPVRWPAWSMLERPENTFLSRRPSAANFFKMAFYAFVVNHLREETALIDLWLRETPTPYINDLLNRTNRLAAETATSILNNKSISFSIPYRYFEDAVRPRYWTSDRDLSDIADGMLDALHEIAFDLVYLQREWIRQGIVTKEDMEVVFSSPFSDRWEWLTSYIKFESPFLPEPVLISIIGELEAIVDNSIEIFPKRADRYLKLVSALVMHNRTNEETMRLLRKVISNNISYGSHKDMLIYSMLEIAESCHKNGIQGVETWLLSLAPAISHISEFTDGDETGYFPKKLGETLAVVSPDLLPVYYLWLCRKEEYFDARSVFLELVKILDLGDPVSRAIAKTAIERGNVDGLKARAKTGNLFAANILTEISSFFGDLPEKFESSDVINTQDTNATQNEKKPRPEAYPPPQIKEFLQASKVKTPYETSQFIKLWLEFWQHDQGLGAYDAVKVLADSGCDVRNGDLMATLAKRFYGLGEAYPWIERANRDEFGWSEFFTKKEFAQARWEEIKRNYPDRWLQFIRHTINHSQIDNWQDVSIQSSVQRLVEYCIFLGHVDRAREIAEATLTGIHELTSSVQFTFPDWINPQGILTEASRE
ncbi:MAG: hypothetical protein TUN42_09245 [Dehalogenimonas sp.]